MSVRARDIFHILRLSSFQSTVMQFSWRFDYVFVLRLLDGSVGCHFELFCSTFEGRTVCCCLSGICVRCLAQVQLAACEGAPSLAGEALPMAQKNQFSSNVAIGIVCNGIHTLIHVAGRSTRFRRKVCCRMNLQRFSTMC